MKKTRLCKASLALNENSDYSGVNILTKEVQQVFEKVLFKKLLASRTTCKFLGFLPKNGVSNTALP